jgi:hypothetical protein
MSGAFNELGEIIKKRVADKGIGFGAAMESREAAADYLTYVRPEDLINFGFESEFIGRLPVVSIFEKLTEADLFAILKNPNNPVILSKKLDFKAYDIDIKFDNGALGAMARLAHKEGTGARSLVSVIEKVLLKLEKHLPSTTVKRVAVTEDVVRDPEGALEEMVSNANKTKWEGLYERLFAEEEEAIIAYVKEHQNLLAERHGMALSPSRIQLIAKVYARGTGDIDVVINRVKGYCDQIRNLEAYFSKTQDLDITLDDDARDMVILGMETPQAALGDFYKKLTAGFRDGLKLVRDRTGRRDFVLSKEALENPEQYLSNLVKDIYTEEDVEDTEEKDGSP